MSLRGFNTLNQMEGIGMQSLFDKQELGRRKNLHHEGSTSGNCIVGVCMTDLSFSWQLPVQVKRKMIGESRIAGVNEQAAKRRKHAQDQKTTKKGKSGPNSPPDERQKEIVNYDSISATVWQEVIHRTQAKGILDLTAKDNIAGNTAISEGVPYLAVTFTPLHAKLLRMQVLQTVYNTMYNEGSSNFDPRLPAIVSKLFPEQEFQFKPSLPKSTESLAGSALKASARRRLKNKGLACRPDCDPTERVEQVASDSDQHEQQEDDVRQLG